eukprot:1184018-Prorocentrum_minimum.AAC.3
MQRGGEAGQPQPNRRPSQFVPVHSDTSAALFQYSLAVSPAPPAMARKCHTSQPASQPTNQPAS